jgi:hypothetical protein
MKIKVLNFAKYNGKHSIRKDIKKCSWFRIDNNFMVDDRIRPMKNDEFRLWMYLLSICSSERNKYIDNEDMYGIVTPDLNYAAFLCSISDYHMVAAYLDGFQRDGLIEIIVPVTDASRTRDGHVTDPSRTRDENVTDPAPYITLHNPTLHNPTEQNNLTPDRFKAKKPKPKKTTAKAVGYFHPWDMAMSNMMVTAITSFNPDGCKKIDLDKWANVFRLMREQDGLEESKIEAVLDWTFKDSFWSGVIQSPEGFRRNWDKITAKMNQVKRKGDPYGEAIRRIENGNENGEDYISFQDDRTLVLPHGTQGR